MANINCRLQNWAAFWHIILLTIITVTVLTISLTTIQLAQKDEQTYMYSDSSDEEGPSVNAVTKLHLMSVSSVWSNNLTQTVFS